MDVQNETFIISCWSEGMRFLCIILSDALAEGGMWVGRDADTGRS